MTGIKRSMMAAAGQGGDATYVEDVFSAYTHMGTGAELTINNGIDLGGEGGMVYVRCRSVAEGNQGLYSTSTGVTKYLITYNTNALFTEPTSLTSFNSDGFTQEGALNTSGRTYVSWSFRQADGFFYQDEVVKAASTTKTVDLSSLGTVGMVAVKRTDSTGSWYVWHKDLTAGKLLYLEQSAAEATLGHITMSGTTLSLVDGTITDGTYVVYAWAHDDQSFGDDGSESIIKCGSFTSTPSWGSYKVDLGWEPQFVLMKDAGDTGDWFLLDSMRGIVGPGEGTLANTSTFYNIYQTSDDAELKANTNAAESYQGKASLYGTGFMGTTGMANRDYVYIAIRRPMKVPEAGTEVYHSAAHTGTGSEVAITGAGFSPDLVINTAPLSADGWWTVDRMRGRTALKTDTNAAESTASTGTQDLISFDPDGITLGSPNYTGFNNSSSAEQNWMFKRAPEFMDVIAWVGDGQSAGPRTVNHNLGVKPELFITKCRNQVYNWYTTYGTFDDQHLMLDLNNALSTYDVWGGDATATTVTVENNTVNAAGLNFVGFLFATLEGVSKVGSYTADATLTTIDCGFTAGARFILIKRVNDTGDWYVYDSVRGIVAGNDPYKRMNLSTAGVTGTDYIDPDNSGFQLTAAGSSTINIDTAEYIFLAVA